MERVYANELRNLRVALRRKILAGTVMYRDQKYRVDLEPEQDRRLQAAGIAQNMGGARSITEDVRVDTLTRDMLKGTPHRAPIKTNVEVDKLADS